MNVIADILTPHLSQDPVGLGEFLILEELLPPQSIGIGELAFRRNTGCPVLVQPFQGHPFLVVSLVGISITGFDAGTHFESLQVLEPLTSKKNLCEMSDYLDSTTKIFKVLKWLTNVLAFHIYGFETQCIGPIN